MASFPTSVKTFTSKANGEVIYAAHIGDVQDEVTAIETAIGARPRVFARYVKGSIQVLPNAVDTVINYNTVESDSLSCVSTGAAWAFTAPTTGAYHLSAGLRLNNTSAFTINESYQLSAYKNGAQYAVLDYHNPYSSGVYEYALVGSTIAGLNTGDTIAFRAIQNSGTSQAIRTSTAYSWCAIARV